MTTIIMPVMNSKKTAKDAIEAILNNTEYPYELYIIDGNSTDGTEIMVDDFADKYNHIKSYHIEAKGLVNAFNYGIAISKGDVYLTHDDVIVPNLYGRDWLEELVKASKVRDIGMVTTINSGGISGEDYLNGFRWVGTWSMYLTKHAIDKVGMLDENMKTGDDIDYCYRMMRAGLNIGVCNFWVDHHRIGNHVEDKPEWHDIVKKAGNYFKEKHGLK